MESLLGWLTAHAEHAYILVFFLLVVTGLSVPISEDVMLVASGVLAATVIPEHTLHLFLAVFLGTYASDNIAYGLGRFFGDKLCRMAWFQKILNPRRLEWLQSFMHRYGTWTLFLGRFIPFGFRNGIFMTAGFGKMPFMKFMLSDGVACLLFTALIFFAAYFVGQNYDKLLNSLHTAGLVSLLIVVIAALLVIGYAVRKKYQVRTNA